MNEPTKPTSAEFPLLDVAAPERSASGANPREEGPSQARTPSLDPVELFALESIVSHLRSEAEDLMHVDASMGRICGQIQQASKLIDNLATALERMVKQKATEETA